MEIALAIIHGAAVPLGDEGEQFNSPISPLFLFLSANLLASKGRSMCMMSLRFKTIEDRRIRCPT